MLAQRDMRVLQTEIGTRGRLAQLERWNAGVLALSAPAANQFVSGGYELAKLTQPAADGRFPGAGGDGIGSCACTAPAIGEPNRVTTPVRRRRLTATVKPKTATPCSTASLKIEPREVPSRARPAVRCRPPSADRPGLAAAQSSRQEPGRGRKPRGRQAEENRG